MLIKAKPPFKLAVAATFLNKAGQTLDDLYLALQPQYVAEKHFTRTSIENAVQSLSSVGILNIKEQSHEGPVYTLSSSGRSRVLKMI